MPIKLTVSQPAPVALSYVEAAIKPEVTGHVTPTYEEQTVYPAAGTVFGSVEVDAIPDPTAIKEIGSNGDHDVRRYGVARVDVQPTLQSKTATPTEQAQTVLPDTGYDGLESVNIARIPTEYIVPTGTKNISQNGVESVREYDSVDVSVVPTLQNKTIVPTKQTQTVNADSGYDGLGTVQVDPIPSQYIEPTGTVPIAINGLVDVSQYANANVQVPQGVFPTGTKQITENGTGIDVTNFAAVDVAVPTPSMPEEYSIGGSLLARTLTGYHFGNGVTRLENRIFENCTNLNADVLPDTITYIGQYSFSGCSALSINSLPSSLTELQSYAFYNCISLAITQIPSGVTVIYSTSFRGCTSLTSIEFLGNITLIQPQAFYSDANILRYVFSHNTAVPTLQNANAFNSINANCKIVVPDNLVSSWKTATNWVNYADKIIGASDI